MLLNNRPGILENGLFLGMAKAVVIAGRDPAIRAAFAERGKAFPMEQAA